MTACGLWSTGIKLRAARFARKGSLTPTWAKQRLNSGVDAVFRSAMSPRRGLQTR